MRARRPVPSWTVGGGGGLSCEGAQGFAVGVIGEDSDMQVHAVRPEHNICCASEAGLR